MKRLITALLLAAGILTILPTTVLAMTPAGDATSSTDGHAADRAALHKMMEGVQKGLNDHSIEEVLPYLDKNVIVTFQDATVARGYDQLKAYYDQKLGSASSVLTGYSTAGDVDAPPIFHGNTAVAYGHTQDHFVFRGGKTLNLHTRWTATVLKEDTGWKIIALQFSVDIFDNPLLTAMKHMAIYLGIGGFVVGLLIGLILRRRKRAAA